MNCPVDGETLQMTERQGVEVDYCPRCRGVWLDRGELDKIIERGSDELAAVAPRGDDRDRDRDDDDDRRPRQERYEDDRRYPKKKKKSFLSDMFEFGGD